MLLLVCYLCFHDDLGAGGGGGVEGDEQEVQVAGQPVHARYFAGGWRRECVCVYAIERACAYTCA